jgi:hypothetical protein
MATGLPPAVHRPHHHHPWMITRRAPWEPPRGARAPRGRPAPCEPPPL